MSRPLVPLARPLVVSGLELRFPVHHRFAWFDAIALPAPRSTVAALLHPPFRPVPAPWRGGSLLFAAAAWESSPVGPFTEVMLLAPSYHGRGSPIPGLATLLHGRLGRTDIVGDYGYTPVWSLVDRDEAAPMRRDLWHVPVRHATIRAHDTGRGRRIEVSGNDGPILEIDSCPPPTRDRASGITMPIHAVHDGEDWSDHVDLHADQVVQRWRDAGRVRLHARGPLGEFAVMLGATDDRPFAARGFAALRASAGDVRLAGPRTADR